MSGGAEDQSFKQALEELQELKTKVEKADDVKCRLVLERLDEEDVKKKAQQEMLACLEKQKSSQEGFDQNLETLQICAQIPNTDVRFLAPAKEDTEECEDSSQLIRGVFTISQRAAVLLRGGQALITFEEEKVASKILKMTKCQVSCEGITLDVKPKGITMETPVKFQVHLDVSRKELEVFDIPPAMPAERMKDRLEMSFSRPSRGGGEVERVDYDENTGTGHITFLHPGVAMSLAMSGEYNAHLESEANLKVGPTYKYDLQKFQTFCGSAKRTVLLDGIKDVEDEEDLQDHLEIHFQKPSNSGGEIESIKYVSEGKVLQAFFCEDDMD
ncbi:N-myc-interactor isoform X2 [Kryptolebias marmoratus]|uniref:N-myc-interactor isoform X2 n=1 Tax=Kryptolebias marmoratus TaxID=37003 RepID=UPI000D52F59A|nr:N-myc-interactor isoform X2 [Kryptolebias marmoratus]